MRNLIKFLFVFLALSVVVASCKDDDEDLTPVISNLEVGHNHDNAASSNDHVGHLGEDLHVEASILAKNKIAKIVVTIHEEGHHEHATTKAETIEWEVNTTYTDKYAGQINATFHEHIDIPANAEAGDYHFHIKVVDQAGLSTEEEVELKIEAEDE